MSRRLYSPQPSALFANILWRLCSNLCLEWYLWTKDVGGSGGGDLDQGLEESWDAAIVVCWVKLIIEFIRQTRIWFREGELWSLVVARLQMQIAAAASGDRRQSRLAGAAASHPQPRPTQIFSTGSSVVQIFCNNSAAAVRPTLLASSDKHI